MSQHKLRFQRLRELTPRELAYCALGMFFLIAFAVTVTAIVESYSNQVDFALHHQMRSWHGRIAPIAVDAFIVLGELLWFAAILLKWRGRGLYAYAFLLVLGGFSLSVAANVWHAAAAPPWVDRAIQALWPVVATAALAGGLIVIKRVTSGHGPHAADEPAGPPARREKAKLREPASQPPAPASAEPPPPPVPATGPAPGPAAAREPELAAARAAAEAEMATELAHTPAGQWPSSRALAGDERLAGSLSTRRRAADRIVATARAMSNGGGHGDRDGA